MEKELTIREKIELRKWCIERVNGSDVEDGLEAADRIYKWVLSAMNNE